MSKKKGAASSRNGRDSTAQRLGVKVLQRHEVTRGHDHRAPARHPVPPGRERRPRRRRHAVRHAPTASCSSATAAAASSSTSLAERLAPAARGRGSAPQAGRSSRRPRPRRLREPWRSPRSSTRSSSTCAVATAARAASRSAARRTCPRAVPTAATAATAATCWLRADRNVASLLAFRDHPHRKADVGHARLGQEAARRGRRRPRRRRARGHGRARTATASCSPTSSRHGDSLARGARRAGRARQRPVPVERAPGAELRRAGRVRRGALAAPRAEAARRRRARRLPERGQVDADLGGERGEAEDRRLPVHHARAAPRRRALPRPRVRARRHPRAHRGRGRGPRPRPPVPAPRRAGARARASCSTSRRVDGRSPDEQERVLLDELRPLPARAARPAARSSSAARPTSRPTPFDGLAISAVTRDGLDELARAARRRWSTRRARPKAEPEPFVVLRPAEQGFSVVRDGDGRVARAAAGRPSAWSRWPTSRTAEAIAYVQQRLPAHGRRARAGAGRRARRRRRAHRRDRARVRRGDS